MYFLSDHKPRRKVDLDLWNSILFQTGYNSPQQIQQAETLYRIYGGRFEKEDYRYRRNRGN